MTEIMQRMMQLVSHNLIKDSPVLSGNMRDHIKIKSVNDHEIVIEIEGKFYDMNKWRETGQIVYTGKDWHGFKGYAYFVNYGQNMKRTKNWVNRSCKSSCDIIANEFKAKVDNRLPL